jgi:predicted site-specific integrase-resolvase
MTSRNQPAPDDLDANQAPGTVQASVANGNSAQRIAHKYMPRSGIVLWAHRSTAATRNDQKSSLEYQLQQVKELERQFGVSCECVELHGHGESVQGSDAPVGFEKLISDIKAGRVSMVVAPSADRMSRSRKQFRNLVRMLTAAGSYVLVGDQNDRSSDVETSGLDV